MTDSKRKRPRDNNRLAKFIVDVATGETNDNRTPATGDDHVSEKRIQKGRARGQALTE